MNRVVESNGGLEPNLQRRRQVAETQEVRRIGKEGHVQVNLHPRCDKSPDSD
jgi:hypothetical protein